MVVLFLHGLAGFKEPWAAGFRAVAWDQRGHGKSGDVPGPWVIANLAHDLATLLNQRQIGRACLVGHSIGGTGNVLICSGKTRAHPDTGSDGCA